MRKIAAAFLLAMLAGAAAAQDARPGAGPSLPQPSTVNGMATEPVAPVGHRQPTEKSLTPQVRQEESSPNRNAVDPLGPLPRICNNC